MRDPGGLLIALLYVVSAISYLMIVSTAGEAFDLDAGIQQEDAAVEREEPERVPPDPSDPFQDNSWEEVARSY